MRLFIAIELPKSFRAELSRIERELKAVAAGGRFVPEDNFHITLRFIGESNDLSGAVAAMHEAVRGIRPFALHLGKCGFFERGASKTAHVGVLGELEELSKLNESLGSALCDNGFACERKRYVPHITLGRSVSCDELSWAELGRISPNASISVSHITLFESVRKDGGMEYRPLHRERFL